MGKYVSNVSPSDDMSNTDNVPYFPNNEIMPPELLPFT